MYRKCVFLTVLALPALTGLVPTVARADSFPPPPPKITSIDWQPGQITVRWVGFANYDYYTVFVRANGRPESDESEHVGAGTGGQYVIFPVPTPHVQYDVWVRGWHSFGGVATPGPYSNPATVMTGN